MNNNTQELVKRAADELLYQGVKPTQQNVRERIGSGSITTINKALNIWWRELGDRLQESVAHPAIPDPVADTAAKLWHQAVAYANAELEDRRKVMELSLAERERSIKNGSIEDQQELKELRAQCVGLLKDIERITDEKHLLQKQLTEAENKLMRLSVENESLDRDLKQSRVLGGGTTDNLNLEQMIELQVTGRALKEENKRLEKQLDKALSEKSVLQLENIKLKHQLELGNSLQKN